MLPEEPDVGVSEQVQREPLTFLGHPQPGLMGDTESTPRGLYRLGSLLPEASMQSGATG